MSGESGGSEANSSTSLDRVATVPNLLSLFRILLIPVFVLLLLRRGTEAAGLILLGVVVSTDWIDGYIARHTGQVSNVGKLLDPIADRLAIAAGLIALVVRDAFPLWAALLVIVRDLVVMIAGGLVLLVTRVRIDVRWIGKIATFALMSAIPWIAWGNFRLPLYQLTLPAGWVVFWFGITTYYVAAVMYAIDMTRAVRQARAVRANRAPV
ncbi:MAG TPA: CDP-diacylglycerol--glycerol-3-phosphate 3-phosphatidyltransferase [Actinomycetota bacterium]|nr:CDP-diacylglycerol--glycerol-3-phosphate 3-phosphatidyltransferase [Actinomycetota bacterium]